MGASKSCLFHRFCLGTGLLLHSWARTWASSEVIFLCLQSETDPQSLCCQLRTLLSEGSGDISNIRRTTRSPRLHRILSCACVTSMVFRLLDRSGSMIRRFLLSLVLTSTFASSPIHWTSLCHISSTLDHTRARSHFQLADPNCLKDAHRLTCWWVQESWQGEGNCFDL